MTTDLEVFCITERQTICESGGSPFKKRLMEKIDLYAGKDTLKVTVKNLKRIILRDFTDVSDRENMTDYLTSDDIKQLLKCRKAGHELVFEYV